MKLRATCAYCGDKPRPIYKTHCNEHICAWMERFMDRGVLPRRPFPCLVEGCPDGSSVLKKSVFCLAHWESGPLALASEVR